MESKSYTLSETGITFHRDLKFEEWMELGDIILKIEKSRLWLLGDFVTYGEAKYGEKYAQALDHTNYDYGTLRNAGYVSRAFPPEKRNPNLTWSHHYRVAKLTPADAEKALEKAQKEGLSAKELGNQIKGIEPQRKIRLCFEAWYEGFSEQHGADILEMEPEVLCREAWEAGQKNK